MSDCTGFEADAAALVAGELDPRGTARLLAHAQDCESCARLLALHRDLTRLAAQAPEPRPVDFEAARERVLDTVVHATAARGSTARAGATWLRAAAAVAAAILLFAAGVAAGRGPLDRGHDGAGRLVSAIRADAAANRELQDVSDSRFTYSDVSFRPVEGDRVALDFDVTTHVQVVEPERSPLARELLVHALLHPSGTGARLKALAHARGAHEPKVRDAVLFAMRRDENLAVRLMALAVLSERLDEPEVEAAVLEALRDDGAVQVRMLALDSLAAANADPGRLRQAIGEPGRPGSEALRVRLAEFERGT